MLTRTVGREVNRNMTTIASSPNRRALATLSVNTTMPTAITSLKTRTSGVGKMQIGQKRPHWAIEGAEKEEHFARAREVVGGQKGQDVRTVPVLPWDLVMGCVIKKREG